MVNSEGKKRAIGRIETMQKRKRKQEYTRADAAGVETMKSSESTQEEKYRMLFKNLPCAVYTALPGQDGPTTFISNKWKDWTGYSPDELYQNSEVWPKCIHPEDREHAVNTYIQACRDRTAYNLEYRIIHKETGQLRYVRDQGYPGKDNKGVVVRVDGIVTDITELKNANNELYQYRNSLEQLVKKRTAELTSAYETLKEENKERKRAEQALYKAEREQEVVLENLSELIVYRDRDMATLWASKSMANWHGMTQEQIVGRVCHKARYGLDEPCENCHIVEAMKSGRRQELDKQLPEDKCWHVIVNPVFSDSGQVIGTIEVSQDITERKKADEELQQSEEKYRTLFEGAQDGIVLADAQTGIIIDCNLAIAEMLERNKSELIGQHQSILHPPHRIDDGFSVSFRKHQHQSEVPILEEQVVTRTGRIRDVSIKAKRVQLNDRELLQGVFHDITEQKQSERALRDTTSLLETIFEHTHIMVAYLDPQFNFVRVNHAYAEADERQPSFFSGKNHFDLYPNEENEAIFRRVVETGIPYFTYAKPFEYAEHPERGVSYWDWSLMPIKNQQGIVSGLVLTLADVTARKLAEEALQASEGKLNAMLKSIADHMSMMDKDLNIIWANDVAKRRFGDDIIGRKCYEVYHGRQSCCEPSPCLALRAFQDGGIHEHDTEIIDKDGSTAWFHCVANVALRNEEGRPIAVLEISKDITERKRADEQLRIRERKLRALLNAPTESAILVDTGGVILDINRIAAQRLGKSAKSLIGMSIYEYLPPDSAEYRMARGKEAIRTGRPVRFQDERGGHYYDSNIYPVFNDEGNVDALAIYSSDITEQRQAEEALRISSDIVRSIPSGLFTYKYEPPDKLFFMDGNPASERLANIKVSESIGKEFNDIWPQARASGLTRNFLNVMKTGKAYEAKDMYYKDNKLQGAFRICAFPMSKELLGVAFENITQHKQAEEALRESEEKFRSLAEQSPNMIFINKKGTVVYANKKSEEVMGYKREELCAPDFDFRALIAPESKRLIHDNFTRHMRGEEVRSYDYCLINKKGERIEAINASKLIQYEGETAILGVVTDITERKKAERALRESEERLKILFESAPDAIYLIDSKGRFVDFNKAALELVGFDRDEVIGKSLAEIGFLSVEQLLKAKENLEKVVAGKLSGPNEYTLKRKDGSHIFVEVRTFPVTIAGEMLTLGIARDITNHKQAQKILLDHRAKLKSLASQLSLTEERERYRLATDLHDQIGQSLVISKIKLDQLRKSISSGDIKEALDDISLCLSQVIEDTRTLTFDLSSPILYELGFEAAVAEWLADQIQEKHEIETEFEDDRRPKPLDNDIMALLFRNVRELLINVVKHAKAHKVKVSTRRIGEHISVRVEDDGVGFDPVEVVSTAVKKAEFGLFSIQERLEQLGGQIEIKSRPGRGTKITMTAPLKCEDVTDRI